MKAGLIEVLLTLQDIFGSKDEKPKKTIPTNSSGSSSSGARGGGFDSLITAGPDNTSASEKDKKKEKEKEE